MTSCNIVIVVVIVVCVVVIVVVVVVVVEHSLLSNYGLIILAHDVRTSPTTASTVERKEGERVESIYRGEIEFWCGSESVSQTVWVWHDEYYECVCMRACVCVWVWVCVWVFCLWERVCVCWSNPWWFCSQKKLGMRSKKQWNKRVSERKRKMEKKKD